MIVNLTKKYRNNPEALTFIVTGGIALKGQHLRTVLSIYNWLAFSSVKTIDARVEKLATIAELEISCRISAEDEEAAKRRKDYPWIERAAMIDGPDFLLKPLIRKLKSKGVVPVSGAYIPKMIVQKVTKKEIKVMRHEFIAL